jgi:hypothetical protein
MVHKTGTSPPARQEAGMAPPGIVELTEIVEPTEIIGRAA